VLEYVIKPNHVEPGITEINRRQLALPHAGPDGSRPISHDHVCPLDRPIPFKSKPHKCARSTANIKYPPAPRVQTALKPRQLIRIVTLVIRVRAGFLRPVILSAVDGGR
jgi:hypothetical protein